MITSEILKIKKIKDFDNTYIESQLKDKSVIRWAIVDIDDEFITLNVSYLML